MLRATSKQHENYRELSATSATLVGFEYYIFFLKYLRSNAHSFFRPFDLPFFLNKRSKCNLAIFIQPGNIIKILCTNYKYLTLLEMN